MNDLDRLREIVERRKRAKKLRYLKSAIMVDVLSMLIILGLIRRWWVNG